MTILLWGGGENRRALRLGLVALLLGAVLSSGTASAASGDKNRILVLVSADAEWKVVTARFPEGDREATPFGETLVPRALGGVRLLHGGWGKISAAASTQYGIDRWRPELLINIGTCGGFKGAATKGEILLVDRTVVYDIVEQMGDSAEAIAAYATHLDVSWVGGNLPPGVRKGLLVSGDRDIVVSEIPKLRQDYGATAADWESGAIAYAATKNNVPVLILRGVSDLVGAEGGEAYGDESVFEAGTRLVMNTLMDQLPSWISRWENRKSARPSGKD